MKPDAYRDNCQGSYNLQCSSFADLLKLVSKQLSVIKFVPPARSHSVQSEVLISLAVSCTFSSGSAVTFDFMAH